MGFLKRYYNRRILNRIIGKITLEKLIILVLVMWLLRDARGYGARDALGNFDGANADPGDLWHKYMFF